MCLRVSVYVIPTHIFTDETPSPYKRSPFPSHNVSFQGNVAQQLTEPASSSARRYLHSLLRPSACGGRAARAGMLRAAELPAPSLVTHLKSSHFSIQRNTTELQ